MKERKKERKKEKKRTSDEKKKLRWMLDRNQQVKKKNK